MKTLLRRFKLTIKGNEKFCKTFEIGIFFLKIYKKTFYTVNVEVILLFIIF